MTRRILSAWLALGLLASCDLEEAERLGLTRASSRSITPQLDGIAIDGSTDLVTTGVIGSVWDPDGPRRWSLAWTDFSGSHPTWRIVGMVDSSVVLVVEGAGFQGHTLEAPGAGLLLQRPGELRFRLDSLVTTEGSWPLVWRVWVPEIRQRVRDDRPAVALEREFSFAPGQSLGRGDTLQVALRNTGVNSVSVYSDHSGVRQIGAYEVSIPPGGRDTLRWVVTDTPVVDRWIDLGWGDWGAHELRPFRTP